MRIENWLQNIEAGWQKGNDTARQILKVLQDIDAGAVCGDDEERSPGLKEKVLELAKANPRYGFRRVHALLEGVNLKAVHRIWREEALALRHKRRRKLVVPKTEGPELTGPNLPRAAAICGS